MKEKKDLKYTVVYNDIITKIRNGVYSVGDKLPTEIELTEIYGVSRITVARALKELSNINLVYRIKKSGTFVNGKLDFKNTQLIIPVILPFAEDFNSTFKGIESVSISNNIFTPFHNTKNNANKERAFLNEILKSSPDAIIVYPCSSRDNIDVFAEILSRNIPIVCLDRNIDGITTPVVTSTNAKNMEQIVTYLAKQGHKNIAFFSLNDRMVTTEEERFNGFCSGMIKNNLKIKKEYIFDGTDLRKKSIVLTPKQQSVVFEKHVSRCVDEYEAMSEKPTAICCINDRSMQAFYNAATARGIRIPEDLTITGFDCLDRQFNLTRKIVSVEQNFFDMGATAMNLVLKILNGQQYLANEFIDGSLIIN